MIVDFTPEKNVTVTVVAVTVTFVAVTVTVVAVSVTS
jgi:hypothetical protein